MQIYCTFSISFFGATAPRLPIAGRATTRAFLSAFPAYQRQIISATDQQASSPPGRAVAKSNSLHPFFSVEAKRSPSPIRFCLSWMIVTIVWGLRLSRNRFYAKEKAESCSGITGRNTRGRRMEFNPLFQSSWSVHSWNPLEEDVR